MLWESNERFKQYLKDFKKNYTDQVEYEKRKETYIKNLHLVRHQAGTALMKLNHMADWYDEEYESLVYLVETPSEVGDNKQAFVPDHVKNSDDHLTPIDWSNAQQPVLDMTQVTTPYGLYKTHYCSNSYAFAVA